MKKEDYELVMSILKEARDAEMECAFVSHDFMKKTWNPFKRYSAFKSRNRFREHALGIDLAMYQIEKKLKNQ